MKIALLLYPTTKVRVDEDSSFWIMHELQKRGHDVRHFESRDLFWEKGSPRAFLTTSRLDTRKGFSAPCRASQASDLSQWDCVFIRKEPPFENDYLYALQLLETIKNRVFVLNDPTGVALCNEKLFILNFLEYIPETLITNNPEQAKEFVRRLGKKVVVKRLNDKGGAGIFMTEARDRNLPSLMEMATDTGRRKVLVQRYITANETGDKRILVLNGKILGTFFRKPSKTDFRANLSVGGSMHRARITPWDEKLVQAMRPQLLRNGLWFAGLDVIGKYISEVNVTSPSGIPEINAFEKVRLQERVTDFIEERVGKKKF